MPNIRSMLSAVLGPALRADPPPSPIPPDSTPDRLYFDVLRLSDTDAMWYYETRRWRGRD